MDHADRLELWRRNHPGIGEFGADAPARLLAFHAAWLRHVPFENITKREAGAPRPPAEFWRDHDARGSGGTCFDLTVACLDLLGYLGFTARPVFCAMPQAGPATHAALLVDLPEGVMLVDVGYALPRPVRLPARGTVRVATPWYDIELMRGPEGELLFFTRDGRGRRFRYRFTEREAGRRNFEAAWRVTCAPGARYMQGLALGRSRPAERLIFRAPNSIYRLSRSAHTLEMLPDVSAPLLAERFEIPEALIAAGLVASGPTGRSGPPMRG